MKKIIREKEEPEISFGFKPAIAEADRYLSEIKQKPSDVN
jgi:hypothetical protein